MAMVNLVVHHVDEDVARALKQRAAASGRSIEAEHRALLIHALQRPQRRVFADVLASMPVVGEDADFDELREIDIVELAQSGGYTLSQSGQQLLEAMMPLLRWSEEWQSKLLLKDAEETDGDGSEAQLT